MITKESLDQAKADVSSRWGEDFVKFCGQYEPLNMNCKEFLGHCIACGGNWGGMLLSGIKQLRPEVWDKIPENMGHDAIIPILSTLTLIGVDCSESEG